MSKLKILLVDDEAELVFTMAERLKMRGYEVDAATDGDHALDLAAEGKYDVAVVDIKMPGIGGMSVMKIIRRDHPETAVILLTGHGSSEDAQEGLRQGAAAYLFKPVNIQELIQTIRRIAEGAS